MRSSGAWYPFAGRPVCWISPSRTSPTRLRHIRCPVPWSYEASCHDTPGRCSWTPTSILECHRVGSWRALTGGYLVETVDECVDETQAGAQRRRKEQDIDRDRLMDQLSAFHSVEDRDLAELTVHAFGLHLDKGGGSLGACDRRDDDWLLCGPDAASLRCGVRLGFTERLRSLEGLLEDLGHCRVFL